MARNPEYFDALKAGKPPPPGAASAQGHARPQMIFKNHRAPAERGPAGAWDGVRAPRPSNHPRSGEWPRRAHPLSPPARRAG
jgi:hypothetical protein